MCVGMSLHVCAVSGALATCGGRDMISELEASDPKAHAALTEKAAAVTNTEAMLWRVEKTGAEPSFLFGTAHVSDRRVTRCHRPRSTAPNGSSSKYPT